MEFLKDLKPEALLVVLAILLVREFLGVLRKQLEKKPQVVNHSSPVMEAEMKLMTKTLETVARHIESQTDLVKGLTFEIKSMREEHARSTTELRRDLDELSSEVRRPRSSS